MLDTFSSLGASELHASVPNEQHTKAIPKYFIHMFLLLAAAGESTLRARGFRHSMGHGSAEPREPAGTRCRKGRRFVRRSGYRKSGTARPPSGKPDGITRRPRATA